jgi:hypothetical protein
MPVECGNVGMLIKYFNIYGCEFVGMNKQSKQNARYAHQNEFDLFIRKVCFCEHIISKYLACDSVLHS